MNLYIESDNAIVLEDLRNMEGQLIDDAIVIARVQRYDGVLIVDNINLVLVSSGKYQGRLTAEDAAVLEENIYYDVIVEADRSGTVKSVFRCRLLAKYDCAC